MPMLLKSDSALSFIIFCSLLVIYFALVECRSHNTEDAGCFEFVGVGLFARCSCYQSAPLMRICAEFRWLPPPKNQSNAQVLPWVLVKKSSSSNQTNVVCTNIYETRPTEPADRAVERNSTCDEYLGLVGRLYPDTSIKYINAGDANDSLRWGFCWRGFFGCNYTIAPEKPLNTVNTHTQSGDTFHRFYVESFLQESPSNHIRLGVRYDFKSCNGALHVLGIKDERSDAMTESLMPILATTKKSVTKAQETKHTQVCSASSGLSCHGGVVLLASVALLLL